MKQLLVFAVHAVILAVSEANAENFFSESRCSDFTSAIESTGEEKSAFLGFASGYLLGAALGSENKMLLNAWEQSEVLFFLEDLKRVCGNAPEIPFDGALLAIEASLVVQLEMTSKNGPNMRVDAQ